MKYIPQGPRVFFPLETLERVLHLRRMDREDWATLYWGARRWEMYIHGATFMEKRPKGDTENMKFADRKLTDDEKQLALGKYAQDDGQVLDAMDEVTLLGYRVTFSYDNKNRCAIVSLIGRDTDCINFDLCMSSRHASVRRALVYAVYKQLDIYDGAAWSDDSGESNWG